MGRFVVGAERDQTTLFPPCLEDWIAEDNPVRVVDAFVDALDLGALGFAGVDAAATGRPGYHPAALLKLYVYGYLNRVPSNRRLEREAGRNVEVMWLTGRLSPDHKTIAEFRRQNGAAFGRVCARFDVLHRGLGARLAIGTPVVEITGDDAGRACGVQLADGMRLHGDLLLLAAGVRPNAELAASAGLAVENGIVVDPFLSTSDPRISALGDCAAFPDPRTGRLIRLESVQAATDHARTISKRLTGQPVPYRAVPWFWSDQAHWKLQIAGLAEGDEDNQVVSSGDDIATVFRFRDDNLVCVETINAAGDHMAARRLLDMGEPITRADLAAHDNQLSALLKARRDSAVGALVPRSLAGGNI